MFASISHTRDFPPAGPAESMTLHSTCMTMASLRYRLLASTKALETLSHRRRSNWNHVTFSRTFSSSMSSFDDMVTTEAMDDAPAVAKMTLHRRPANSLSMEFMRSMSDAIKSLEAKDEIQAVVLTSGLPNGIFSAGLELTELYQPSQERLPQFWDAFQQLYLDLYGSRLSTVAALEGHAPAAGCMLALSCDYRVMTSSPKCTIGLNESQLGIVAPPWLCQQYIDTMGTRQAELALLRGTLFSPQEALEVGLVDELAHNDSEDGDNGDSVLQIATKKAVSFAKIPAMARVAAKKVTRGKQIEWLVQNRREDTQYFCSYMEQAAVQKTLGGYLEMLAKRKK